MRFLILFVLAVFFTVSAIAQGDPCYNQGFENDFDGFNGESSFFNKPPDNNDHSCDHVDGYYAQSGIPTATGMDFSIAQGTGVDPFINAIDLTMVRSGSKSARINDTEVGFNIDKLTRTFTLPVIAPGDTYKWYYSFALVMENPTGHGGIQPFFQVNVCVAGNCDEEVCFDADMANLPAPDNQFMDVQQTSGTPIVFRNWECTYIEFPSDLSGQEVTVEFVASDCGAGAHWGYAYVDAICEECGPNGSVELDPIIYPCDIEFPLEITGTLTMPQDGSTIGSVTANDIRLRIVSVDGSPIILTNPVLNLPNFTFTIQQSDIPQDACFDVRAEVAFTFNGQLLPPVYSLSANPNTTDDFYNDFCTSHAECSCEGGTVDFGKREGSACVWDNAETYSVLGNYEVPKLQPGGFPGTVQSIEVSIYNATSSNTPPSSSDLVLGPLTATVNPLFESFNASFQLSLLGSGCYHVLVKATFICDGSPLVVEQWGYYNFCWQTEDCQPGTISVEPVDDCKEPIKVCGSYTLPVVAGYEGDFTRIRLTLFRTGFPLYSFQITDFDRINQTYCFELTEDLFPNGMPEGCWEVTITGFYQTLEGPEVSATAVIPSLNDVCFTDAGCCEITMEGSGYCSLTACDNYAEKVFILVRKKASTCQAGGYIRVTVLTPGEFYNVATGQTYNSLTTGIINYTGTYYYASFVKAFHDYNGDDLNCFRVDVYEADNTLIETREMCFDADCIGDHRTLGTVDCHPDIPAGPAHESLTFYPTSTRGEAWVRFTPPFDSEEVCIYGKVRTYREECCASKGGSEGGSGSLIPDREFCIAVNTNPFLINLNDWNATCADILVYSESGLLDVSLLAEGCFSMTSGSTHTKPGLEPNPVEGDYLTLDLSAYGPYTDMNYTILNMVGMVFQEGKIMGVDRPLIDISTLPQGVYMINLNSGGQKQQENLIFIKAR